MRQFKGAELARPSGGNPKAKLMIMGATLLVLGGALVYQQNKMRKPAQEPLAQATPAEAILQVPEAPDGTFEGVLDSTPEQRVQLERSELEVTKAVTRRLLPAHFEQLETIQLGPATFDSFRDNPAALRGELVTVRGKVEEIRSRSEGPGRVNDWFGRLWTVTGEPAYFVTLQQTEKPVEVGDWVRVDGMFFKFFAEEDLGNGEWIEAPLVVAPRLTRSFEDFGEVADFEAEKLLILGLTDDTLESATPMPELLQWRMLALMRDMPEDAIDWAAAPTLDGPTMSEITRSGEAFRGQPFILPVSKMQGMKVLKTGENAAGLSHRTEAWIANQEWTRHEPLLHVIAPGEREHLGVGSLVNGRVIYLRNMAYTTSENTRRVVPVFAGYELSKFVPEESPLLGYILGAFLGLTALMAGLIAILVQRDKRKSEELQKKLLERKRIRREKSLAGQGA